MRAKCINDHNAQGIKDPELTVEVFYPVKSRSPSYNINDQLLVTVESAGVDIERPSSSFKFFK